MTLLYWIFLLLVLTFFLPYNVDRPTRRIPFVTYGLMTANIVVFFLTVVVANTYLNGDQIYARQDVETLLQTGGDRLEAEGRAALENLKQFEEARKSGEIPPEQVAKLENAAEKQRQKLALQIAAHEVGTAQGYEQYWRLRHLNADAVWEPHYSVMNVLAYRVSEPSAAQKVLGLFGSMFLHGSIMHLLGNMLFLWVFGRAVEEALNPVFALGAYIVCGLAATLLHHLMTLGFAPGAAGIPLMGASGAIAGVIGLFALRFYRTPVHIFYVLPTTLPLLGVGTLVVGGLLGWIFGSFPVGLVLGFIATGAALAVGGRNWAWGHFKVASMYAIGVWVVAFNLVPAMQELLSKSNGGVAHWAHVGGFLCGIAYAALIGFKDEGAKEYLLEDAHKELNMGDSARAIAHAQNLTNREPHNADAYRVLALALDDQKEAEAALENYEKAIELYLQSSRREKAVSTYLDATAKNPRFILPPGQQFAIASQMARGHDWQNAAENFFKVAFTYPDAPEAETSLLRAAQIYGRHLERPDIVQQLMSTFLKRHPDSLWREQAEKMLAATRQMNVN